MIAFFENGKFEVNDHSDPDLDLYRIRGSAIEGLDSEVLFDADVVQFVRFFGSDNCRSLSLPMAN